MHPCHASMSSSLFRRVMKTFVQHGDEHILPVMDSTPAFFQLLSSLCLQAGSGNTFELNMVVRIPPNQIIWYRSVMGI
jgi:hypothetical protein